MSQIGRTVKNLEAPRPLKSTSRQSHHTQVYAVQSSNLKNFIFRKITLLICFLILQLKS